jgi:hypothetical protein
MKHLYLSEKLFLFPARVTQGSSMGMENTESYIATGLISQVAGGLLHLLVPHSPRTESKPSASFQE